MRFRFISVRFLMTFLSRRLSVASLLLVLGTLALLTLNYHQTRRIDKVVEEAGADVDSFNYLEARKRQQLVQGTKSAVSLDLQKLVFHNEEDAPTIAVDLTEKVNHSGVSKISRSASDIRGRLQEVIRKPTPHYLGQDTSTFKNSYHYNYQRINYPQLQNTDGYQINVPRNVPSTTSQLEAFKTFQKVDPAVYSEKWIVITSIHRPTADVKQLSSIAGWKVVVVGDRKTPPDWSYPNCVYLSVEKQMNLGYNIIQSLPWNSYSRKNIGYLYAIQHGAKYIFDTDDDNHPTDGLRGFVYNDTMSGLVYASNQGGQPAREVNPYAHFGQPSVWPRGYPLDKIASNMTRLYHKCQMKTPSIQQGVVNGDPDVDAIFRLTRKNEHVTLNLTFDKTAPSVVIPFQTYSPFNSQNTLYHYSAFWGLLLPFTTPFRVCDIWRGYWAKRLMEELDDTIGFVGPNCFQFRNSHSYFDDAVDEEDLYYKSTKLVDLLRSFRCASSRFYDCVLQLTEIMARADMWKAGDVTLVKAWLADLNFVGYAPPQKKRRRDFICDSKDLNGVEVQFYPVPQVTTNINSVKAVKELQNWFTVKSVETRLCPEFIPKTANSKTEVIFDDILLIVVFNRYHFDVIPVLETLYRPHFPNILYCGEFLPNKTFNGTEFSFYAVPNMGLYGHYAYECMMGAVTMGYAVSGYLLINDDVRLNIWNLHGFDRTRLMFEDTSHQVADVSNGFICRKDNIEVCDVPHKHKWLKIYKKQVYSTLVTLKNNTLNTLYNTCYKNLVKYNKGEYKINFKVSDVYYIPTEFAQKFYQLATVFREGPVFVGLAVPTIIRCLDNPDNVQHLNHLFLWTDREEGAAWTRWKESQTYHSFHPYKLSPLLVGEQNNVKHFCKDVLPMFYSYRPYYWR